MRQMRTYVFQPWQYFGLLLTSGAMHLVLVSAVAFFVPSIDAEQFLQGLLFIAVLEILIVMRLRKSNATKPAEPGNKQPTEGPKQ